MRKLFVTEYITLDGVTECPGGEPGHPHTGWTIPHHSEKLVDYKLAEAREMASLLIGRRTFEGFAEAWQPRTGDFADHLNAIPKHVVSTTLDSVSEWNNSSILRKVPDDVAGLKAENGGAIGVAGSTALTQSLLRHGLVDELRLVVFPVILGSGDRLFAESPDPIGLSLQESRTFPHDVVLQIYTPTAAS